MYPDGSLNIHILTSLKHSKASLSFALFTGSELLPVNERDERKQSAGHHCWHRLVVGFTGERMPEFAWSLMFINGLLPIL